MAMYVLRDLDPAVWTQLDREADRRGQSIHVIIKEALALHVNASARSAAEPLCVSTPDGLAHATHRPRL